MKKKVARKPGDPVTEGLVYQLAKKLRAQRKP